MESKATKTTSDFRMSLHGLPYDQTIAAKAPRTSSTPQKTSDSELVPSRDSFTDLVNGAAFAEGLQNNTQDASTITDPLPPKLPSAQNSPSASTTNVPTLRSLTSIPSVPQILIQDENVESPKEDTGRKWLSLKPTRSKSGEIHGGANTEKMEPFLGLTLDLPNGALGDELKTSNMQFSNRGSMLLDGKKLNGTTLTTDATLARPTLGTKRIQTSSSVPERLPPRIMSTDEETLSEKVRLYYALGSDTSDVESYDNLASQMSLRWQDALHNEHTDSNTTSRAPSAGDLQIPRSPSSLPVRDSTIVRDDYEFAGGLEDWQDIENDLVDRYGFIVPKMPTSSTADGVIGVNRSGTVNRPGLQRVSTSLQLAAETPRRKHTIRKPPGSAHEEKRTLNRKASNHSTFSHSDRPASSKSATVHRHSTMRAASNRLPGNKDRRLMDEAADMLTLPRSLTAGNLSRSMTQESDQSTSSANRTISKSNTMAYRKKEAEREEKWRKMAITLKDSKPGTVGGGMLFSFPHASDVKLVSRTWKGIPDSWRSAAWHYFLTVSARKNPNSLPDDALIQAFYSYQDQNSPDDVQIDIDVPRTISSHIMFRRRYRGGQRLLFRVLHAMSLHFAETGYVQGMAALTATLLAYYEEEKAFVMLVRLWEVRGLGRLYQSGFDGLMEALGDFEKDWLGAGEVAKQLAELNIGPTAYGTKWYLTLFNYSIPFPAQLRVWDVFMLLGDDDSISNHKPSTEEQHPPLGTSLDILHATSAALIDGMRDILLESDFENAMKVLTSWIPIRDEDLFMRVAKAEWKMHKKKG